MRRACCQNITRDAQLQTGCLARLSRRSQRHGGSMTMTPIRIGYGLSSGPRMSEHGDAIMTHALGVLGYGTVQAVGTRRCGGHSHATCGPGIVLAMTMQAYAGTIVTAQPTCMWITRCMHPCGVPGDSKDGVLWSPAQNQVMWPGRPVLPSCWVGRLMALRQQQPQGADATQKSPREEAQLGPHLGA